MRQLDITNKICTKAVQTFNDTGLWWHKLAHEVLHLNYLTEIIHILIQTENTPHRLSVHGSQAVATELQDYGTIVTHFLPIRTYARLKITVPQIIQQFLFIQSELFNSTDNPLNACQENKICKGGMWLSHTDQYTILYLETVTNSLASSMIWRQD